MLRDRTSISPDCSAVKRSFAVSGTNLTLVLSPRTAAAIAWQYSTSIPSHSPFAFGLEKPGKPVLTPQVIKP
ncbi:Uncharacterised protein [Vibrio cholerae]|nr:Uncharacterised protein [Vibrio cholerae]